MKNNLLETTLLKWHIPAYKEVKNFKDLFENLTGDEKAIIAFENLIESAVLLAQNPILRPLGEKYFRDYQALYPEVIKPFIDKYLKDLEMETEAKKILEEKFRNLEEELKKLDFEL
jgi:hypothetical protein